MTLHHTKHHQAYVDGLNKAEESYSKSSSTKEQIALQAALKFNGGGASFIIVLRLSINIALGHINHSLFWNNLAPAAEAGGKLEDGPLKSAIESTWGSVDAFKKDFNTKTAAIQGSGWGWLVSLGTSTTKPSMLMPVYTGIPTRHQETRNCHYCKPRSSSLCVVCYMFRETKRLIFCLIQRTFLSLGSISGNM